MISLACSVYCKSGARGFNLVEAAIVLGVVGLVIGGIWVAASTVSENHKINQTITGIGQMTQDFRNMYSGLEPSPGPFDANLFKFYPGWTKRNSATCCTSNDQVDPFGNVTYFNVQAPNYITFNLYNLPKSRCMALAIGYSRLAGVHLILGVGSSGGPNVYWYGPFPINVSQASDICISGELAVSMQK